ncbi:S8 family serine peptidase [Aquincola sp. S2]|uniref:S8 family serine peptidase n=1 Tax=Pseudaquabacterium terrae TaxID=2732868 RepID=A0ABX2ET43_9BURK|nr:S8 family serine peptidase [Aquabacterium terrae]NRF71714.1 S8 family serine peptidase [Aquabacterium terrae]
MTRFPSVLNHPAHGRMTLDTGRLLLAFGKAQADLDVLRKKLAAVALTLEESRENKPEPRPLQAVNHTDRRFWVRVLDGALDDERLARIEKALGKELAWIGPVYRLPRFGGDERSALLCPVPDVLLAKLRTGRGEDGPQRINAMVRAAGAAAVSEDSEKSRYLGPWHYLRITDPKAANVYQLRDKLIEQKAVNVQDLRFESMPLLRPAALVPDDPLYTQQWNMTQVGAPAAWDLSTGSSSVVVCVLDEGCDLAHPDLVYSEPGINLGTMSGDGSPTGPHGTACAGVVAAVFGNTAGVAGLAGNCQVMPLAFDAWTDVEVAAGINYAADNGARVISMSFGWNAWDPAIIDPAIQHAHDLDVVMCVATHNQDGLGITYPATNSLVMACGASDQVDNRKTSTSPDGEFWWGSNFGPEMSVVAPGVLIPTTDQLGAAGYDATADYIPNFNGTSSATPLVAGLAALLRSVYPALTSPQVRDAIERSAEKVGAVAYADTAGYPNGTWNQEMGYGRINAYRAMDLADVIVRDQPSDSGDEPGPGGNFWDFSDVVVRINDDDVFVPSDPSQSKHLELGQTNYLYVRVRNNGPREARNVVVSARLTPFVGTQFVYPHDWAAVDATHLSPTPMSASFPALAAGAEVIAKFSISAAQVQTLWDEGWHPCCVASVTADNDYAFGTAPFTANPIVTQRNNLAQRNLSVINVLADAPGARATFPFLAGHALNAEETMQLVMDRSRLPKNAIVRVALDEGNLHFPKVDLSPVPVKPDNGSCSGMVFLERTRVKTRLGCCEGVLTIEKGSSFDCAPRARVGKVKVQGGQVVLVGDQRYVEARDMQTVITVEKAAGQVVPMSVQVSLPTGLRAGERTMVSVAQRNAAGQVVGGASALFVAAE